MNGKHNIIVLPSHLSSANEFAVLLRLLLLLLCKDDSISRSMRIGDVQGSAFFCSKFYAVLSLSSQCACAFIVAKRIVQIILPNLFLLDESVVLYSFAFRIQSFALHLVGTKWKNYTTSLISSSLSNNLLLFHFIVFIVIKFLFSIHVCVLKAAFFSQQWLNCF